LVTAVLQSSSATTVMVIGFINAGLLSLLQALGIVFGANIGTTMTAQLVAFKLDDVIMPAIIAGLIISFIKWRPLRGWGDMLLGFGLLFFGMKIMSSDLKIIADFPSFAKFFQSFDCAPVNGSLPYGAMLGAILIGVIVTVIIQSSSATTGIVIALGAGGLVNLYTAVALILGSNIGTTITAILAALPANRVAKQAALAHTLFNVIGVIIVMGTFWITWQDTGIPVFFYAVNFFTDGNAFALIPQNMPRHIANAHTLFNVFTTLILVPVIPLLARICERLIPVRSAKVRYQYLEPNLINNPAIALDQTVMVMRRMLRKAWKMVDRSIREYFIHANVDEEGFAALEKREKRIDDLQSEITNYLTLVMQRKLSERQAKVLPLLMHCTNDAERVADHTEVILMLTRRLAESGHKLSEEAIGELNELQTRLSSQAECAIALLDRYEEKWCIQAAEDKEVISKLVKRFEETHIARLRDQKCNAAAGVIFIELLGEVDKISSRLSNIVERAQPISQRSAVPTPVRKAVQPESGVQA
ncbi:MAG: Na/Pi cotransporter family protein, partial [Lentisphaeria bacterium]|nr:Na/Pi cotransporter family protein [Lentisphaeria bacterium]